MQRGNKTNNRQGKFIVVSNSSVIIALARICYLYILEEIFGRVIIPEAVWKEVTVEGKAGREKIVNTRFIEVQRVKDRNLARLLKEFVDAGEAEAIVLARELGSDLILIDERKARTLAKRLGLEVMGTLGVIALAKYKKVISEVRPVIDKLIESGFWISSYVLKQFLRNLNE